MSTPFRVTFDGETATFVGNALIGANGRNVLDEYLDGELECAPHEDPVVLFHMISSNGLGAREVSAHLVGTDILVYRERVEDCSDPSVHTGFTDPAFAALDELVVDIRAVAVASRGPLLDGDWPHEIPTFQHTPWEDIMGGDASDAEQADLDWVYHVEVDPRVRAAFVERLAAGFYPELAEMSRFGSVLWRRWVCSLLTAVPPEAVDGWEVKDGYPLYTESDLAAMADDALREAARRTLRAPLP
jgi:hypothetical protein